MLREPPPSITWPEELEERVGRIRKNNSLKELGIVSTSMSQKF